MAIKKRLTPEQRAQAMLPTGWRRALRHDLLKKQYYKQQRPTAIEVASAINMVKGWKGATWDQKVFVMSLDMIMEKAFGQGILDPDTYNRLSEHLYNNEPKIQAASFTAWHVYVWDIYHDGFGLDDMKPGELYLPPLLKKAKNGKKKKKRRILKRK